MEITSMEILLMEIRRGWWRPERILGYGGNHR